MIRKLGAVSGSHSLALELTASQSDSGQTLVFFYKVGWTFFYVQLLMIEDCIYNVAA